MCLSLVIGRSERLTWVRVSLGMSIMSTMFKYVQIFFHPDTVAEREAVAMVGACQLSLTRSWGVGTWLSLSAKQQLQMQRNGATCM